MTHGYARFRTHDPRLPQEIVEIEISILIHRQFENLENFTLEIFNNATCRKFCFVSAPAENSPQD